MGGLALGGFALLFAGTLVVVLARWAIAMPPVQQFLLQYPGETSLPPGAPVGIPAWLAWQHYLNAFLIVLIVQSGLRVRAERRPAAYWTARGGRSAKISLNAWFHQALDVLWLLNGLVYVVLLFATGQWVRIVPASWDVLPNAVSAALQYASLNWPTENGWVNYNGLQQLAYFATVFIAAPLAVLTGVRMSLIWPARPGWLSRGYPAGLARAIHFPVMLFFVAFIVTHVGLVLATGALRNLNHMYAGQDAVNWAGFWIFLGSSLVILIVAALARPAILAPLARLFGTVSSR